MRIGIRKLSFSYSRMKLKGLRRHRLVPHSDTMAEQPLPSISSNFIRAERILFVKIKRKDLYLPFHAAEQRGKKQRNDSAKYPARGYKLRDFPRRLLTASSTGKFYTVEPSERLPFGVRFWASKNEHKS
jgi:hypothetical protein